MMMIKIMISLAVTSSPRRHGRMFCKLLLSFVLQTRMCDSVMKENYGCAVYLYYLRIMHWLI